MLTSAVCIQWKNLLEMLFPFLLCAATTWNLIVLCVEAVLFQLLLPVKVEGWGWEVLEKEENKTSLLIAPLRVQGKTNCLLSVIWFVCIWVQQQHTQSESLSAIYWCYIVSDCLPCFWFIFFL